MAVHCPSCGVSLPREATFCPHCGAIVDADAMQVEPVETVSAAGQEVQLGSRRGGHGGLVAVALAVVLVVAVVVAGRDHSRPTDSSSASTSIPSTTLPSPTTSVAAEASSSAPANPTTSVQTGNGPMVPGAVTGAVVEALAYDGRLVHIDLDRGTVTSAPAPIDSPPGVPYTVLPVTGGVVLGTVYAPGDTWFVPDEVSWPAVRLPVTGVVHPAADPAMLWVLPDSSGGPPAKRIAAGTGEVTASVPFPAFVTFLGDDGTGALLVWSPGGGTYRIDGTKPPQRVADQPVLAWNQQYLVDLSCDARLVCSWHRIVRATGKVDASGALEATRPGFGIGHGRLSLDGRYVAVAAVDGGIHLIDLTTNHTTVLEGLTPAYGNEPAWVGGDVLVWVDGTGHLRAWRPGAATAEDLSGADLPRLRAGTVRLAPTPAG